MLHFCERGVVKDSEQWFQCRQRLQFAQCYGLRLHGSRIPDEPVVLRVDSVVMRRRRGADVWQHVVQRVPGTSA